MEFYLNKKQIDAKIQSIANEGFTLKSIEEKDLYEYLVYWFDLTANENFEKANEMLENNDFGGLDELFANTDNYYVKGNNSDTVIELYYDNLGDGNECITVFAAKDYRDDSFFLFSCNGTYSSWNETMWECVKPVNLIYKEMYFIETN